MTEKNKLDVELNPIEREALDKALKFLDYRLRTSGEIRERMRIWGYSTRVRRNVVDYLEGSGLVDDREFARVFMQELLEKQFGFYRVREKLLSKRLDRDVVEEVMADYPDEQEYERAFEICAARAAGLSGEGEQAMKRKLTAFLERRGFSGNVARDAVRSLVRVDTESGRE